MNHNFNISDWMRWLAQDESGVWWGYSVEPLRHDSGWYENEVGRCVALGLPAPENWKNSLRPVSQKRKLKNRINDV